MEVCFFLHPHHPFHFISSLLLQYIHIESSLLLFCNLILQERKYLLFTFLITCSISYALSLQVRFLNFFFFLVYSQINLCVKWKYIKLILVNRLEKHVLVPGTVRATQDWYVRLALQMVILDPDVPGFNPSIPYQRYLFLPTLNIYFIIIITISIGK